MKQLRKELSTPKGKEPIKVNRTLKPVKKGNPFNTEIEEGEYVLGNFASDGIPETYVAGGNKHYDGGTNVNLPDNSFIFSDHKSMKITDEDIQKTFNKPEKKSGYTPAELAKQYNINKYRKILAEEDSDKMQRKTAESMIKNYNEKLGMLALVQESKKGFDSGIPFVSIPYLESMGIDPAQFVNGGGNQEAEVPTESEEEIPQQKKGGQIRVRITKAPGAFMQKGGAVDDYKTQSLNRVKEERTRNEKFVGDYLAEYQKNNLRNLGPDLNPNIQLLMDMRFKYNKLSDADYNNAYAQTMSGLKILEKKQVPYQYEDFSDVRNKPKMQTGGGINPFTSKTIAGKTTPTGENSDAKFDKDWYKKHYGSIGIDVTNMGDQQAQALLYDKADPFLKAAMWGSYGDTAKGATKDRFSKFGLLPEEDFNSYKTRMANTFGGPEGLTKELASYKTSFADGKSGIRTATLLKSLQKPEVDAATGNPAAGPAGPRRTPGDIQANSLQTTRQAENTPFWTEDIVNTAGAFGDLQRIKKYMPWQAGFDTVLPEPTYYDPTRELAANSEQANIAAQALASYSGPQSLSARLSGVQGAGLSNAANILGKYNTMNVDVANQNEASRVAITNETNLQKAGLATNLYDKTVMTNQNFDNAKAMARQNLRQSFVNGWTNRGKTQQMNSMNQDYRIDPTTGYVEFKDGKRPNLTPAQQRQDATQTYLDIRNSLQGTQDPDAAAQMIFKNLYGMK